MGPPRAAVILASPSIHGPSMVGPGWTCDHSFMTVRDTLLREHRFLEKLLERLEAATRADERSARLETRHLLILLSPCLDAHLGIERVVFQGKSHVDNSLRVKNLQGDLHALLESGDRQAFPAYCEAVSRMVTRIRARLQAEGSWRPRHQGRPVDVVNAVKRRLGELERHVEQRAAGLNTYVR